MDVAQTCRIPVSILLGKGTCIPKVVNEVVYLLVIIFVVRQTHTTHRQWDALKIEVVGRLIQLLEALSRVDPASNKRSDRCTRLDAQANTHIVSVEFA